MIDRESNIPYYCQLMEIMHKQVKLGVLKEGQRIPSEFELSSTFRVNRHTIRQAVGELCRTGLLYKMRGRGTFVAKPPLDLVEYRLSSRNRFTENIRQSGMTPGSKLLAFEEAAAPPPAAEALGLATEDSVYALDVLRLINDQPFLFSKVFLPVKYFPCLPDRVQDFQSLSAIYEAYDLSPRRVKSVLRASYPSQEEAMALDIPGNMPVLKVENSLKSQDDVLIEYSLSCYRGDLAKLSVDW